MSLQDNIFDIEAALEGKPEAELFEQFVEKFGELERRLSTPPQETEYCDVEFYYQGGPPDIMHHKIERKIEQGWRIVQLISWPSDRTHPYENQHWKVIFVRSKR